MEGDISTKVSPALEPGVRKFTLSCSRCRASKLKCDRKQPCMECVNRNLSHLCTKDERQPRAKRLKTDHNKNNNDNEKANASRTQETEAEEAAQVLEHFIDESSRTNAYRPVAFDPTLPSVKPDYPDMYWSDVNNPQRQDEKLTLIREIIDAMPELDMVYLLYEVFVTRCQGALGNVVHTPTFMKQAGKFSGCLRLVSPEARVVALSSAMPIPALACHLLALVLALAFHSSPSILGWSSTPLTIRVEELRASSVHSRTWRSLALRCLQGRVSLFCGSIASLQSAIMLLLDGQEGPLALDAILVTAISGAQKLGLHRLGDAKLEVSPSPTLYSEDGSSTMTEPHYVRTEIGIRIWWALVMRDWSRGQAVGYYSVSPSQFDTRIPLHINDDDLYPTTSKVNVHGHITERPRSEFTMLSYTVHALEIAVLARESIDMRGPLSSARRHEKTNEGTKLRNHLNKKYEDFVAGLPAYFRLGSTVGLNSTGPMEAIPIQRWMLHQQLWNLFLRLYRTNLSHHEGSAFCQLLAQNIISTQTQIQERCTVCGSLSTSETQLFNAAIVLLIDLLFSSKRKDVDRSSFQLSRLITREKVREAVELMRSRDDAACAPSLQDHRSERFKASAQRSVVALNALMKLEEEEAGNAEEINGAKSLGDSLEKQGFKSNSRTATSLKNKVLEILKSLEGNTKKSATAVGQESIDSFSVLDMSTTPSLQTSTNEFQDLDVLPVLSNDPGGDLWQFLDFAPPTPLPPLSPAENGSSATADLQTGHSDSVPTDSSDVDIYSELFNEYSTL